MSVPHFCVVCLLDNCGISRDGPKLNAELLVEIREKLGGVTEYDLLLNIHIF